KPISENAGKGVFANITNEEYLRKVLVHVREELNYKDIIVEEFVHGVEYRVYMVGDKVIAAVNRRPANVVGNGTSTIMELIIEKNKMKRRNPVLSKSPIEVDKEVQESIKNAGYTMDSILPENKLLYLRNKS